VALSEVPGEADVRPSEVMRIDQARPHGRAGLLLRRRRG